MTGSVVSKWRRSRSDLRPVTIDGELEIEHVDAMLTLAYEFGIGNIFVKAGRPVMAGPGEVFSILSDRRMSPGDVERFCRHIYRGGDPISQMLQGNPLYFRYDLPVENGEYVSYRGSMKKIDGIGENNFAIAIRPLAKAPPKWEELEIEDPITRNLLPDAGLNMFVGKTDSGKTTMQSSAIDFIGRTCQRTQKIEEYGMP